jgi:hypothetical protein
MSRAIAVSLVVSLLILLVGGFFTWKFFHPPTVYTHIHAGFHIYVGDQKQDFSGPRYMSLIPCSEGKKKLTPAENQLEKAHLHDQVGDVVHVHHQGATWGDLLRNIDFAVDPNKSLVAYSNGQPIDNLFTRKIHDQESVVVIIGDDHGETELHLKNRVTAERIAEVEQASELCGSHKE